MTEKPMHFVIWFITFHNNNVVSVLKDVLDTFWMPSFGFKILIIIMKCNKNPVQVTGHPENAMPPSQTGQAKKRKMSTKQDKDAIPKKAEDASGRYMTDRLQNIWLHRLIESERQ